MSTTTVTMTRHGLAILPRVTHYDINVVPALATSVASFLDQVYASRESIRGRPASPQESAKETAVRPQSSRGDPPPLLALQEKVRSLQ
jgi:hypothetical protein